LYIIDLKAGEATHQFAPRKMEVNSDECESWHSWSSNSRWIVFSSKRAAPLFNRPHLAYVDLNGKCSKPFVVPQQDPDFYDSYLKTYTIPVLTTEPMRVSERALIQAIVTTNHQPLIIPVVGNPNKSFRTSQ
jgi:hypothetical protein